MSTRLYTGDTSIRLSELRRVCLRHQLWVCFQLPDGQECCINQHGATVVDGHAGSLDAADSFERAVSFRLKMAGSDTFSVISRKELEGLAAGAVRGAGSTDPA